MMKKKQWNKEDLKKKGKQLAIYKSVQQSKRTEYFGNNRSKMGEA